MDNSLLKQHAHEKYYFLDDLMEFNRLLNVGTFSGSDVKSVIKLNKYLEEVWKKTKQEIEENAWYKAEKKAMEELDIETIMKDGSGQYDPNYKVTMDDVFRKVFKDDKKNEKK
jgi:hypothetical protein